MYPAAIDLVIKNSGSLLISGCTLLWNRSQWLKAQQEELFVPDIGKVKALKRPLYHFLGFCKQTFMYKLSL